jgi:hypothetical protein
MEMLSAYGGKCVCCGESEYKFLAIDHINGGGSGRAYYPVTQASSTTDTGGASLSTDSTSPTFQYIDVIVCTKD